MRKLEEYRQLWRALDISPEAVLAMTFLVSLFVLVVLAAWAISEFVRHARTAGMRRAAEALGLTLTAAKSRDVYQRLAFIDGLRKGRDRYACNVITGTHRGHAVTVFDFHFTTGYGDDSKEHRVNVFILHHPLNCREVLIYPRRGKSRFWDRFSGDVVTLESAEFDKAFAVRSMDRKLAYDICHPQFMQYLLARPHLALEFERDCMAVVLSSRISPSCLQRCLDNLVEIAEMLPGYLIQDRTAQTVARKAVTGDFLTASSAKSD